MQTIFNLKIIMLQFFMPKNRAACFFTRIVHAIIKLMWL